MTQGTDMPLYTKKPVTIEAITFDELVEHGRLNGAKIVNGMPWSWKYKGHPITHENDDCYLIPTLEGTMKFHRGDMLITGVNGEIYPCKIEIFRKTYDPVSESNPESNRNVTPDTLDSVQRGSGMDAQGGMNMSNLVIGMVYNVNHCRKGKFLMQIKSQCETWAQGVIVNGVANAILDHNIKLTGESISVRKSYCKFTLPNKEIK